MPIHPTAIIDARAEVHPHAEIGPYVVVDGPVRVGPGTRVLAHVTLLGWTRIGAANVIHPGAVLGDEPQDLAYDGSESYLDIGDRNVIREHVHIHRGTQPRSSTIIGNDNYFMNNSHVAHNCRVGDHVILANGAVLGGYVQVEDRVFLSAGCAVHQYVRIGRLALMRGLSRTSRDVPPFCIVDGTHTVRALNRVGLRRAGFTTVQIRELQVVFRRLFRRRRNLAAGVREIDRSTCSPEVGYLLDFIHASKRGVCVGPRKATLDDE